jgi:hypothetical protein
MGNFDGVMHQQSLACFGKRWLGPYPLWRVAEEAKCPYVFRKNNQKLPLPALLANAGTDIHHLSLKAMLCAVVLRVKFQLYASDHIPSPPLYLSPFFLLFLAENVEEQKSCGRSS